MLVPRPAGNKDRTGSYRGRFSRAKACVADFFSKNELKAMSEAEIFAHYKFETTRAKARAPYKCRYCGQPFNKTTGHVKLHGKASTFHCPERDGPLPASYFRRRHRPYTPTPKGKLLEGCFLSGCTSKNLQRFSAFCRPTVYVDNYPSPLLRPLLRLRRRI